MRPRADDNSVKDPTERIARARARHKIAIVDLLDSSHFCVELHVTRQAKLVDKTMQVAPVLFLGPVFAFFVSVGWK